MDYIQEPQKTDTVTPHETGNSPKKLVLVGNLNDDAQKIHPARKENAISKKRLVNKLNYLHFKNKSVRIQFKKAPDNLYISIDALPQPSFGRYVVCLWEKPEKWKGISSAYHFNQFELITDEQVISVPATVRAVSDKGICLALPDRAVQHTCRKTTRYSCMPLTVKLIQSGVIFSGTLKDFSTSSFRVALNGSNETSVNWINTSYPINAVLMSGETPVYSGECRILRHTEKARSQDIILAPSRKPIQRFSPRVHRSKRIYLKPSPDIQFDHPVTGSMVNLKVLDVSGSGLAVEDDEENSVLLPGLVLPALTVNFSNSFSFVCQAQVLYRRTFLNKDEKPLAKCGIAFLDVNANDHIKLLSMLHNAENQNIYICNTVDTEKLWEFFFETGFIYPKKYAFLNGCSDQIKKTYNTLYSTQSGISRHFTWQKKGEILAHLAMLRFYEKSWLIHHLAAKTSKHIGAGIEILNQISDFTLNSHRLASSNMDYLLCYFRPEMRFPNHFFGGIARDVQNPKACSIDSFAYILFRAKHGEAHLPKPWTLDKPETADLTALDNFYTQVSGGLMLNVLDMLPDDEMVERKNLATQYQEHGLTRERRVYALKKDNCLKAVIMVNISDIALNLSDLTNCVSLFIVEKEGLEPEIIHKALSLTAKHYPRPKFPVLVYPADYVHDQGISYNRIYQLWALSMEYSDECLKYYSSLF
ncbi:MAG: PilZ domain-containing protein [Desulfosalsimonadaceae bacterium]